ncbi:MAG TPA: hypothetical protein VFX49_20355 [Chloroflexota bacterium]|nr:hypothetical protein [Chloroflexota bacterium]
MAAETETKPSDQAQEGALAPGALMFAILGGEHPERHGGLSVVGRELAYTLHRAIDHLERGARAGQNPSLLMRGGKAAWLVGEVDVAGNCYRAALPQFVELAEGAGRNAGTSADYYRLALAAGWMAMTCAAASEDEKQRVADNSALRGAIRQMQSSVQRLQGNTGQALTRLALDIARVRGGWLSGDMDLPRYFVQAEQHANALDTHSKSAFVGGRDQLALAAIRSVVEDRPEQHGAALSRFDAALQQLAVQPPSVTDLVDEELLALQAAALKRGAKLPALKLAPAAGAHVSELLPLVA